MHVLQQGGNYPRRPPDEPAHQQIARPPTVIGGGGAGAVDMRARAHREAEAAAEARALQQAREPVDLQAEEHFPGLQSTDGGGGGGAVPRAGGGPTWGRGGAALRHGLTSSGDFPVLGGVGDGTGPGLSKGQRKKLKSKAKRGGAEQYTLGDESGLPPPHVMALGADAAARAVDDSDAHDRGVSPAAVPSSSQASQIEEDGGASQSPRGGRGGARAPSAGAERPNGSWGGAAAAGVAAPRRSVAGGIDATASSFAALGLHEAESTRQQARGGATETPEAFPALSADGAPPGLASPAAGFAAARARASSASAVRSQRSRADAAPAGEDFPSLGGGRGAGGAATSAGTNSAHAGWSTVGNRRANGTASKSPAPAPAPKPLSLQADFPTLGGRAGSSSAPDLANAADSGLHAAGKISRGLQGANEAVLAAVKVRVTSAVAAAGVAATIRSPVQIN